MVVGLMVAAAALVGLGFVLSEALMTPEQVTLRTEPERAPITDPIRREVLEDVLRVDADVVATGLVDVPPPSGVPPVVTAVPLTIGDQVESGVVVVEVVGRPLIALRGVLPAWRDFTDGMTPGPDVAQLQQALAELGFYEGEADGRYGRATRRAVGELYEHLGYPAPGGRRPFLPQSEVLFLPGPLRVARSTLAPGSEMTPGSLVLSDGTRVVQLRLAPELISVGMTLRLRRLGGDLVAEGTVTAVMPVTVGEEEGAQAMLAELPEPETGLVGELVVATTRTPVLSASPMAIFDGADGPYVVVLDEGDEIPIPVEVGVVTARRVEIRGTDPRLGEGTPLVLNPRS